MTQRLSILAVLFGSLAAVAAAQDSYTHGRVLSVEPGVTLQRATEQGSEEAAPNLPFLPGDRVWSDRAGRAEFQFADGTLLRLDSGSKLDYVAEEGDGRVILRLWSGGLYLHARDGHGHPDFAVETPGGVVEARARGVYRIDAAGDGTRLSVYEGEATLLGERDVVVQAGERLDVRQGEAIEDPQAFDRAAQDDFDHWNGDRDDRPVYAASPREYLPEVTDNLHHLVDVDDELRVRVGDPNQPMTNPTPASRGTVEQTHLLKLIALGRHLGYGHEVGPLLLDDVTSNADPARMRRLLALLHRIAQQRQVIVFAHEAAVAKWAGKRAPNDRRVHLHRLNQIR